MKNFWQSELFLKFASIFAAILLWIFVVYQENPVHETWLTDLSINYTNHSANLVSGKLLITEGNDMKVDIKIRGRRSDLSYAKVSNVTCSVDLGSINAEGSYDLPIDVDIAANGVELVSKNPYSITVVVDRVVTEERDVTVKKTGTPKNGFMPGTIESSPSSVKLTGPYSLIKKVETAVATVDVTDASEDITGLYKIKLYDADGKEITSNTISKNIEYCDIKCPILSAKTVNVLPFLADETNHLGHAVTVALVRPDTVTIVGKKEQIDQIDAIFTETIPTSEIFGKVTINAQLDLSVIPDGVFLTDDITSVMVELSADSANNEQDSGEAAQNNNNENNNTNTNQQ